jgi:hypothetical protein
MDDTEKPGCHPQFLVILRPKKAQRMERLRRMQ